jgi:hypothetical protein
LSPEIRQLLVSVEVAPTGDRFWSGWGSAKVWGRRVHGESAAGPEYATGFAQDSEWIVEEEEHDGHRHCSEHRIREGQSFRWAEHHMGAGRPLSCQSHHLLAVVESCRVGTLSHRIAEQEPTPASDIEHVVAWPERQSVEDRAAGEVVDVFASVHDPGAGSRRPTGNAVGEPVVEVGVWPATRMPARQILVAELESTKSLCDGWAALLHGSMVRLLAALTEECRACIVAADASNA